MELEPRVGHVISPAAGSKSVIVIEGWTQKDTGTGTFRNKLVHYEHLERSDGKNITPAIAVIAWLHFQDLAQDEERLWRFICTKQN